MISSSAYRSAHGAFPDCILIGSVTLFASYRFRIGENGQQNGCVARDPGVDVAKDARYHGCLHGYGIARRIEQTRGNQLSLKYGTVYPAVLELEQEGYIASESDNP
jgi:Transcriptional regulator PadR-like family